MGCVKQIRDWAASFKKKPAVYSVQFDEVGITQTVKREDSVEEVRLPWDDVVEIYAYKLDLYAVDQICWVIKAGEFGIEVREDDRGYEKLIAHMESNIPGFPGQHQWFEQVALPPFETNWTKIFSRESSDFKDSI